MKELETRPVGLKKIGDRRFEIKWADGRTCSYEARTLRQGCRCAACRDEITGARTLDPESVPADIAIEKATLVGNYAVGFAFTDGHQSGIYSFDLLRALCEEAPPA